MASVYSIAKQVAASELFAQTTFAEIKGDLLVVETGINTTLALLSQLGMTKLTIKQQQLLDEATSQLEKLCPFEELMKMSSPTEEKNTQT